MRILTLTSAILNSQSGSGGTVLNFSEQLRNLGHEVTLLGPDNFEPLRGWNRLVKLRQAYGASSLLKSHRLDEYDLIEFYGDEYWLLTKKLLSLKKRPLLVAHTNGFELAELDSRGLYRRYSYLDNLKSFFYRKLSKKFFSNVDLFVSLSEFDAKSFSSYFPGREVRVVKPGLAQEFLNLSETSARDIPLAYTGSWITRKGKSTIVSVVEKLMEIKIELVFHVFGAGPSPEFILKDFNSRYHERIIVHKPLSTNELINYLLRTQVFLFPSLYEGFGLALSEAMACGCACIATPTGFGAEIKNGVDGFISDFNDREDIIRRAIELLEDPKEAFKIGRAAKERVKILTWERAGIELAKAYTDLTQNP